MTLSKTLKLSGTLFSLRTRYILVIYKCTFFSDCNFWCCLASKATYFDRETVSILLDFRSKESKEPFSSLFLFSIYTVSLYSKRVIPFCSWNTFSFQSLAVVEVFLALHTAASLFYKRQWTRDNTGAGLKPFTVKRKGETLPLRVSAWVMI